MSDLDPSQAASVEDLAAYLRQLYLLADKPAYRTLEQRTLHISGKLPGTELTRVPLRRSTLSEVLRGQAFPRKAFFLTFVEQCGIQLEVDPRWEKAWDRVALQDQAHPPESILAQHHEQSGEPRRHPAEAEQQARAAENHELEHTEETATARLNLIIRRAEVAESLLQWEREQSGSRFASVCMPQLDEGMTEGTVVRWLRKKGQLVQQEEPLVQITTPTRVADHACPIAGTLRAITVAADTTAAVGTVLAVIEHDPARDLVRVCLPPLGKSAADGVITRWFKKEGERVEQDEPLLELATNLADVQVPSPAAGILRRIVAAEDETVTVGAEVAVIDPRKQKRHLRPPSGSVVVSMPQLGESVTDGTVTRWLKQEGERVERDEPLLEISTDKVDTEIPSPATGVVCGIAVEEDETVEVGGVLVYIDTEAPAPRA